MKITLEGPGPVCVGKDHSALKSSGSSSLGAVPLDWIVICFLSGILQVFMTLLH